MCFSLAVCSRALEEPMDVCQSSTHGKQLSRATCRAIWSTSRKLERSPELYLSQVDRPDPLFQLRCRKEIS
jgi:TfoX/Sxy family transcriptional regulator of competence genes